MFTDMHFLCPKIFSTYIMPLLYASQYCSPILGANISVTLAACQINQRKRCQYDQVHQPSKLCLPPHTFVVVYICKYASTINFFQKNLLTFKVLLIYIKHKMQGWYSYSFTELRYIHYLQPRWQSAVMCVAIPVPNFT